MTPRVVSARSSPADQTVGPHHHRNGVPEDCSGPIASPTHSCSVPASSGASASTPLSSGWGSPETNVVTAPYAVVVMPGAVATTR